MAADIDLSQMQDPLGLLRLGYTQPLLTLPATRWRDGQASATTETIAEETPVAIVYNGIPHVVMMATPQDLEDFALGFSLTEELIASPADLQEVQVVRYSQGIEIQARVSQACEEVIAGRTRRLTGRTGCGICGADSVSMVLKQLHPVAEGVTISGSALRRALEALSSHQSLNAEAGAVHAAAWAGLDGAVQVVREDVGRHNALDKLIGALLKAGTDPRSGFIVVTSRASFEMVQKTTVLGAPLLAAISGPTGLAVRVARQAGLTLVGFARGGGHTVYTHPERLTP
ncbi:MAG TPA: formate dehydrogenase accessory sulfurtransferase FdhD [Gemmatimonadales bacterium]|nr:formate dehydrogenase accessory sulfurtransferase FdhD [Gemmatimonadales bacterium]